MNDDAHDPDSLTPDAPAPADSPAGPDAGDAPAKPARRKRAPRKSAAANADAADATLSAEASADSGGSNSVDPVAQAVAVVVAEASGEPLQGTGGDAQAAAGPDAGAPEGAEPRSGRNRRRNRRGRDKQRGERAAEGGAEVGERPPREARPQEPRRDVPPVPAPSTGELFAQLLSGEFDVEADTAEDAEAASPAKRVLAAEPDAPKLHKVLAQAGIGSRRDMEQMIVEGRVTVNGEPAHIGMRISFGDQVRVNGKPVKFRIAPPPPRVIAYHKPVGEVVTHDDPQQRPTVFRKLPKLQQGKWQSVGRLDINTEGLLLFSNSGELANQLMHPRFNVEREYAVRVLGTLDDEAKARLLEGVEIDGQKAGFKAIEDAGGSEGVNHWYRVVITEGRNREVRKLFDAVGLTVNRLIRVRYGTVVLPRGLKRGVWVELDENDVRVIRRLAGGESQQRSGKGGEGRERREGRAGGKPGPQQQPQRGGGGNKQRGRGDNAGARRGGDDIGPIPNPLQQTYDKRALLEERNQRRIAEIDDEDGPIPNPLQQTYDKRFVQKPRGAQGGAGGRRKGGGGGGGGGGAKQPDPMQTSVGYIGADAFLRTRGGGGKGRGGGGGGGGGGGRRRGR